jgi:hypothetical protein
MTLRGTEEAIIVLVALTIVVIEFTMVISPVVGSSLLKLQDAIVDPSTSVDGDMLLHLTHSEKAPEAPPPKFDPRLSLLCWNTKCRQ